MRNGILNYPQLQHCGRPGLTTRQDDENENEVEKRKKKRGKGALPFSIIYSLEINARFTFI